MPLVRNAFLTFALLVSLVGCGGGGGGGTDPAPDNGGTGAILYAVSISTSGLTGTGLSVNLLAGSQNDSLSISSDGVKSFGTRLGDGASYSVTIAAQPSGQTCSLGSNRTGTIASAEVTVALSCVNDVLAPTATNVRVNVDTLADSETVTLTLNGTETKTFSGSPFNVAFSTKLYDGDRYEVTLDSPPAGKLCNLYNAADVVTEGVLPLVTLACSADTTPTYTVGGPVTGLSGNGLRLKLNGTESVAVDAGSPSYAFLTPLLSGARYAVAIETHPEGQICSLQNEEAYIDADRTDVGVICSTGPYTIGGTVTGLSGTGLTLSLNGVEDLPISSGGSFLFPTTFSDGMDYAIAVKNQPTGQECTVYRGEGWNISASQSDALVECVDKRYAISVSTSAFSAETPLVLRLNEGERLEFTSTTWLQNRTFDTELKDGATYQITILAQPSGLRCTLSNASGAISGADVNDVTASCIAETSATGAYPVSVTTTGLLGSGLQLSLNGGGAVAVTANGYSTLPTTLEDGTPYTVEVAAQPMEPLQRCRVENGTGIISGAGVTNVAVVCGNGVAPLYSNNGAQWLAYVKNPDVIPGALPDTACEADTDAYAGPHACLNGGEYRVIEADYLTNCDGVSAADNLNAFDWICDSGSGSVRIMSTGLRSGLGLSDLIDFEAAAFKKNFVTITSPGSTKSTQATVWWDNPVRVDNSGGSCCSSYLNDIVLVTDNVPAFYTISDKSALLIQPGFAISGYMDPQYIVSVYDDYYDTDFTWLEGRIDDVTGGTSGGVYLNGRFTVLKNVEVTNTGGTGISISGGNTSVKGVTATGNAETGIYLWGSHLNADGLTATGNRGTGPAIQITSGATGTVRNIVASDNPAASAGLRMPSAGDIILENVTAHRNGGDGVNLGDWSSSSYFVRNVTANENGGNGILTDSIDDGEIYNLSAHRNGADGVHLGTALRTPISTIDASGNGEDGIELFRWDQTTVDDLASSDNGAHGLLVMQSNKLIVSKIVSANNGSAGLYVDSTDNSVWSNVTTANNAGNGMMAYTNSSGADPNVFIGVTTVNNAGNGLDGTRFERFHFSSLLSAYNLGHGINTYTFAYNHVFADVASANNGLFGISLASDGDYFTGLLTLGTNASGNCIAETYPAVDFPGLTATGSGDCGNGENSDAVIVQNADLTASMIGALATNDSVNPDDILGAASHGAIAAWSMFDHDYRAWGADGSAGRCTVGNTCRIWDWSVAAGDSGKAGAPALLGVLTLPTGDDTLTINWAATQEQCDLDYPGSVWDGTSCTSTYLRHATEIVGDGLGNENYLCESNETCLYTPNIGSYQGHGDLVAAGSIGTGGTLTNITLKRYSSNGR